MTRIASWVGKHECIQRRHSDQPYSAVIPSDQREPRNLQLFLANQPPIDGCPIHDASCVMGGKARAHQTQQGGPPSHKEWTASSHSGLTFLPAGNSICLPCFTPSLVHCPYSFFTCSLRSLFLQRPLEQRRRDQQRSNPKDETKTANPPYRNKTAILQQNRLESVNRIRKGIDRRNALSTTRETPQPARSRPKERTAVYSALQTSRAEPADHPPAPSSETSFR